MSELQDLIAKRDALNETIKNVAKQEFGALIAGLFESEPELKNFGWWNAPESAYNDGASPGLTCLDVNIDVEERYIDIGYHYKAEGLVRRVRELVAPYEDLVLEIFEGGEHYGSPIVVVFEDRIETYDAPDY